MPPQHVEIAETIAGLKRALRREKEGIYQPLPALDQTDADPACPLSSHRPNHPRRDQQRK